MGNLLPKRIDNGGVFIPWVIDGIGHITEVPGPAYIIPTMSSDFEQKLLTLLQKEGKLVKGMTTDNIPIIG